MEGYSSEGGCTGSAGSVSTVKKLRVFPGAPGARPGGAELLPVSGCGSAPGTQRTVQHRQKRSGFVRRQDRADRWHGTFNMTTSYQ